MGPTISANFTLNQDREEGKISGVKYLRGGHVCSGFEGGTVLTVCQEETRQQSP